MIFNFRFRLKLCLKLHLMVHLKVLNGICKLRCNGRFYAYHMYQYGSTLVTCRFDDCQLLKEGFPIMFKETIFDAAILLK